MFDNTERKIGIKYINKLPFYIWVVLGVIIISIFIFQISNAHAATIYDGFKCDSQSLAFSSADNPFKINFGWNIQQFYTIASTTFNSNLNPDTIWLEIRESDNTFIASSSLGSGTGDIHVDFPETLLNPQHTYYFWINAGSISTHNITYNNNCSAENSIYEDRLKVRLDGELGAPLNTRFFFTYPHNSSSATDFQVWGFSYTNPNTDTNNRTSITVSYGNGIDTSYTDFGFNLPTGVQDNVSFPKRNTLPSNASTTWTALAALYNVEFSGTNFADSTNTTTTLLATDEVSFIIINQYVNLRDLPMECDFDGFFASSTLSNIGCYAELGFNNIITGVQAKLSPLVQDNLRKLDLIFPLSIIKAMNNNINLAQATTSDIAIRFTGHGSVFPNRSVLILGSSTTAWIINNVGFDYKTFFDYVIYLATGGIMLLSSIQLIRLTAYTFSNA